MVLMLACAALFVYLRLRADLDDRVDANLVSRITAIVDAGAPGLTGVALEDPEEAFAQLLSPAGEVLVTVGTLQGPALSPAEARRAVAASVTFEGDFAGVDGQARVLTRLGRDRDTIVVVGQSLVDRNEALSNVVSSFAVGGVVAIVLASMIGYFLAAAGLAPVEAMRRRADEVSLLPGDEDLPLPVAHDEIRRLGETLNEMLGRLRASFERESRFVADASHELRTPIAIIKTELEAALQIVGSDASVQASLVAAIEECDRLGQLAEDLLVIARAADGQLPIRPELTNLQSLLDGVRDRFGDRAGRRGRGIRVEADPSLLIYVDPIRFRQALGNLVENALRHGEGEIALVARSLTGGIEVDVSDEGPGLHPDAAAQAFKRFASGDRARSGGGVGLGLPIVQAIAETHGGSARVVDSAPTTLRIWLPNAR